MVIALIAAIGIIGFVDVCVIMAAGRWKRENEDEGGNLRKK